MALKPGSLAWLDPNSLDFPPLERALDDPPGLLAVGGDLQPPRLLQAYREGIFPWFEEGSPLLWWSPDPRMLLLPSQFHCSRSLRRRLRQLNWTLSMDRAFSEVIAACAALRRDTDGTWITEDMQRAYCQLHQQGHAHSVEVWEAGTLIGGLYGISIGAVFCGESMFSRRADASKVALLALTRQLQAWQYGFIDCQLPTEHLHSMGARPVPRARFKQLLWHYRDLPGRSGHWQWQLHEQASQLAQ